MRSLASKLVLGDYLGGILLYPCFDSGLVFTRALEPHKCSIHLYGMDEALWF